MYVYCLSKPLPEDHNHVQHTFHTSSYLLFFLVNIVYSLDQECCMTVPLIHLTQNILFILWHMQYVKGSVPTWRYWFLSAYIMKSTLKVHNPRVIILLIHVCINDVQGKELSFQVCNI